MRSAMLVAAVLIGGMIGAYSATVFTPVSQDDTPLFTAANPGAVKLSTCP